MQPSEGQWFVHGDPWMAIKYPLSECQTAMRLLHIRHDFNHTVEPLELETQVLGCPIKRPGRYVLTVGSQAAFKSMAYVKQDQNPKPASVVSIWLLR